MCPEVRKFNGVWGRCFCRLIHQEVQVLNGRCINPDCQRSRRNILVATSQIVAAKNMGFPFGRLCGMLWLSSEEPHKESHKSLLKRIDNMLENLWQE